MGCAPEGLRLFSDLFSDRHALRTDSENSNALKDEQIVENGINQEGKCLFYGAVSATDPLGKLAMIPS